jgi:hypothetical protein
MGRIGLAIRVFFRVLFDAAVAKEIGGLLAGGARSVVPPPRGPAPAPAAAATPPAAARPQQSEAITLLATLQREARLVDFLKEPLSGYSDAQIGAAVRDVHRDCGKVLERLLELRPIASDEEGAAVEVPAGFDAGRWRLTGNVAGEPPFRGRLVHHGWEATVCRLPVWSGTGQSVRVIAPVEVELS